MGRSVAPAGVYTQFVSTMKYRQANKAKISIAARLYRTTHKRKRILDPVLRRARNRKRDERRKAKGADRRAYFKARQARLAAEIKAKRRLWRIRDKEKTRAYQSKPQVALGLRLRQRLHGVLGVGTQSGRAIRLLGCSLGHLKFHLEALFEPGMTWENRGHGWHVDHVLPLSSFDLTDQAQLARACHFTNLQPLWARDNMAKGAKITA